jgi:phosphatidylinositol alpha-mannosyltransferase
MKIGLVCPYHIASPGGVQKHIIEWSFHLKKMGHHSRILSCGPAVAGTRPGDIIYFGKHIPFPVNQDMGVLSGSVRAVTLIKNYLDREKFDILHFHEPFLPFLSWQILQISKTINVATFHAYPEASALLKLTKWPVKNLFLTHLTKKIQAFSAVSKPAASYSRDFVDHIEIIPNAIDPQRFQQQTKISRFSDGKLNLLYVGRLTKRKGIRYLLEAIQKLEDTQADFRLVIVGSGPWQNKLEQLVKKFNLKNVVWEGCVSNHALPAYFASADIFCAPAVRGESFGIILLEAMAAGLPIVASSNAGYKEILKPQPFAEYLVKPEDSQGFYECLHRLMHNPQKRNQLSELARSEAQKYSWDRIGEKIIAFYLKAMG